jgi:phosphate transport system protein
MSARSRGLVERMGEVAASIWRETADTFAARSVDTALHVEDLDDELDDLHVTLTAELVAGTMPLPVAIELAMVARFYERFGDHAVNLARRMAALVGGGTEPGTSGPD